MRQELINLLRDKNPQLDKLVTNYLRADTASDQLVALEDILKYVAANSPVKLPPLVMSYIKFQKVLQERRQNHANNS